MPLENGLDDRLITSSDLQQYFVNKANGEANAGGSIRFWVDTDRTTPKPVYELVQDLNTFNYSYEPLPNPLTLSGVGTVVDSSNNDIPIYWFPYDGTPSASFDNLELYYVEVFDSKGQLQFTREAWPYPLVEGGNTGPTISSLGIVNQLTNPQFTKVLFQEATTLTIALVGNSTTEVEIAPGWTLRAVHSASGNITVTQTAVAGTEHLPYNPPFVLTIGGNSDVTDLSIYQQLNNNPDWAAPSTSGSENGFLSGSILLGPGTGVNMQYVPSAGNAAQPIINETNNTTEYEQFNATIQLTAANNPQTGVNGYDRIVIRLSNPTGESIIGNVQVLPLTSEVEGILFEQTPANRQLDQMFNYYKAGLDAKAIPSYLIGWDFPLNPAQVLGDSVAAQAVGANKSYYAWDQTILFQTVNSGITTTRGSDGSLVLTAAATTQVAVVQYLEAPMAKEILANYLSSNLRAFTDNTGGISCNITLWYTTDAQLPNVASGTNNSLVSALDATTGFPTCGNGTWTQVGRSNLGNATFTLANGTTYTDYPFANWKDTGTGSTTATYFAIVISFGSLTISNKITIQSISLVPGKIATIPAPKSITQSLLDCERYYWDTFPYGVVPSNAPAVNVGGSIGYICQVTGTTAGYGVPVEYPTLMRAVPVPAFYNPSAGAAGTWYNAGNNSDSGAASIAASVAPVSTLGTKFAIVKNPQIAVSDVPANLMCLHVGFDARLGIVL